MFHQLLLMTFCNIFFASGLHIDDYLDKPEPVYNWTKYAEGKSPNGGTVHYLNVTSLRWLDTSKAYGPQGDIWSHRVMIVVPKVLKYTNVSVGYITMECNGHPNEKPTFQDIPDYAVGDEFSHTSGAVTVVIQ